MRQSKYDLEDRTTRFGENIIVFCKNIKYDLITKPLISQIIRSSTSIGANYREANAASSRKDFRNKIHIVQKEILETKHWLQMMLRAVPEKQLGVEGLQKEYHELALIFGRIIASLKTYYT